MRQSTNVSLILASVGVLALAPSARADDFVPAEYRGQPLSTFTEWEFGQPPTNFNDIYADVFTAVAGPPEYPLFTGFQAKIEVDFSSNWMWVPGDGDGGLTPAPGVPGASFGCKIPNFIDNLSSKRLRVQISYLGSGPSIALPPGIESVEGWYGPLGSAGPSFGVPEGPMNSFDSNHVWQDWIIIPNPAWELAAIYVPPGTIVDEIIIDAISIPTPGALVVLALASLVPARRRRAN